MCLKDAIEQGKLDPEKVFYMELPSRNIVSLKGAIDQNKWNLAEGKIIDPRTGREISIAEAIENKVIEPEIDADKALEQASSLKFLRYTFWLIGLKSQHTYRIKDDTLSVCVHISGGADGIHPTLPPPNLHTPKPTTPPLPPVPLHPYQPLPPPTSITQR